MTSRRANGEGSIFSLPQWVRCLCLHYDSVREASAQVRLRTNTGDSPQPVDRAHAESRTRAGSHQGADSWAVPQSMARRHGCSESCPAYESHVKNYIEPGLGALRLDRLRVADVQAWLNCLATQCQCCAPLRRVAADCRWIASGKITAYRVEPRLIRIDLEEIEAKIIHTVPTVNGQHDQRGRGRA